MKQLSTEKKQPKRVVPCEVYSRIVGYLRPLQDWGPGKVEEFKDRKVFKVGQDGLGD